MPFSVAMMKLLVSGYFSTALIQQLNRTHTPLFRLFWASTRSHRVDTSKGLVRLNYSTGGLLLNYRRKGVPNEIQNGKRGVLRGFTRSP